MTTNQLKLEDLHSGFFETLLENGSANIHDDYDKIRGKIYTDMIMQQVDYYESELKLKLNGGSMKMVWKVM